MLARQRCLGGILRPVEERTVHRALQVSRDHRLTSPSFLPPQSDYWKTTDNEAQHWLPWTPLLPTARANGYGSHRSGFVEYAREVNRKLLLVGQIESRKGLEEIEEIIGVENGLDVAFWSSSDLSKPGQVNAPAVQTASQCIIDAALAAGKVPGLAQYEAAECAEGRAHACSFFVLTSASGFLTRKLLAFRREVDVVSSQVR